MATSPPDPDTRSPDELKRLVARLLARVAALEEENRRLREENARLKDLPKRPRLAPGGMDRATGPAGRAETRRRRRTGRGGRRTPPATEERVLTVAPPPGSRRKGYQPYTVQDLVLSSRVVRYRRGRGGTPGGGQLVALLTARKDAFHAEADAILEAGLASARWVTVDDTGARHAGREETTTHVGDDRFAWFATRPSRSRLGFLELLRAGRPDCPDYVINAAAAAYMLERGVP